MPGVPGLIRVGHKGADHVAPGNTIESFQAALEHGVDMIEFDVLRTRDGRLVLSHDYEDADSRDCLTLDEGLDHFAGAAYADVQLDVDMKLPGYEREVAQGLAQRGLAQRSLVSTMYIESLEALGELAPGLRRGWSVPRVRRDYTRSALALPAYAVAQVWRANLPEKAARPYSRGRLRGGYGAPDPGQPAARAGRARGGRPGLRVDRGRRRPHPLSGGAGGRRRDLERPAAVLDRPHHDHLAVPQGQAQCLHQRAR